MYSFFLPSCYFLLADQKSTRAGWLACAFAFSLRAVAESSPSAAFPELILIVVPVLGTAPSMTGRY
jgi:hypothetical protein